MIPAYNAVPVTQADEKEHRRELATAINRVNQGKFNCALEITLIANVTSTTISDARIGAYSVLVLMPVTADAAAEIGAGTIYIPENTMLTGSAVIQHANNSQTDRSFRVGIFG